MALTKEQMQAIDREMYNALVGAGLSIPLALIQVAQARHESGNYNSRVFQQNNNAYGYLYVPGNKFGATQGLRKSDTKNKGWYANFPTPADSARAAADWVLSPKRWPLIKNVQTLAQYAHALKTMPTGAYYEASEAAYAAALQRNYSEVAHLVGSGFVAKMDKAKKAPASTKPAQQTASIFF